MRLLLVTGATGFVGRNLLVHVARNTGGILAPVRDAGKLARCLREDGIPSDKVSALSPEPSGWQPCTPSHAVLAAGVLFARSREEYLRTNVEWTLRVLEALPPDCRVVVLSSQSAGGPTPAGRESRSERDSDAPVTWYGESKLALERAIAERFSDRKITVLRPPMILGARDSATLPLFKMARGWIRTKPGLRRKEFTYLDVEDVVRAILASFELDARGPFYIGSEKPVSDIDLISAAARAAGAKGATLAVPLPVVRLMAGLVDAVPTLRASVPSLTRDRAREIWPDRWVVDSGAFRRLAAWSPEKSLEESLLAAYRHYRATGQI